MPLYVNINGVQMLGNSHMTILQLCVLAGIYIPRFCYHEKLSIVGSCRMCLVEVCKSSKPMVSCATPLIASMDIYTETALVKNAREHILEFLLINHPLDCPICDQGGECDLQDQSLIYGSDLGRFKDSKRAVLEKNLGPFIKTVMTRCIHCTRCVRFMSEISNTDLLGILGRGKDMEIGTYITTDLVSEISGNIIDLCPVGALTSKPFAFTNRSWELRSTESIDVLDGLGSSIRIDLRGAEVVRVLPKTNEYLNEQWITNKIRFTYDGLKYRRLSIPFIHKKDWAYHMQSRLVYINASWEFVCKLAVYTLIYLLVGSANIYFLLGDLVDLDTILFTVKLVNLLGSSVSNDFNNDINIDLPCNFKLNKPIPHFEKSNIYLFLGCDVCFESPLLNVRVSKQITRKPISKKTVASFGLLSKHIGNYVQLGVHANGLNKLIEGRHFFCARISNSEEIVWVTNLNSLRFQNVSLGVLNIFSRWINKKNSVNTLHTDCSTVSQFDVGFVNHAYKHVNNYSVHNAMPRYIYNVGFDSNIQEYIINYYIIYQGHHNLLTSSKKNAFIFLPSSTFVEKTGTYVNTEGRFLFSKKAVTSPGLAKSDIEILKILGAMLLLFIYDTSYFYQNSTSHSNNYVLDISHILIPQLLYHLKWRRYTLGFSTWWFYHAYFFQIDTILTMTYNVANTIYYRIIDNYYNTSVINSASKVLSKINMKLLNYGLGY